jgi:hypothetical protein
MMCSLEDGLCELLDGGLDGKGGRELCMLLMGWRRVG